MTANPYMLHKGAHPADTGQRCAMEWVAWIAGEDHSDSPACVSPILAGFCRSLNDVLDDGTRQKMRPYLARCIGTAGDGLDTARGYMCLDWIVRTYTPAWLELAGMTATAASLRGLPEITDLESARNAGPVVHTARTQAYAVRDAAGDAAWAAAWAAAGDAAWAAAWDAARAAAWAAARAAARDAARAAARAAAGDAARDALQPTVHALRVSAFDLLDRMLPTVPLVLPEAQAARAQVVACEAI
jgi:hypothetical protein